MAVSTRGPPHRKPGLFSFLHLVRRFSTTPRALGYNKYSTHDRRTPRMVSRLSCLQAEPDADCLQAKNVEEPPMGLMPTINTLLPEKLTHKCFLDFSGRRVLAIRTRSPPSEKEIPGLRDGILHIYRKAEIPRRLKKSSHQFAAGTHGFLYFHLYKNYPSIYGELRIRVTERPTPENPSKKCFEEGYDLTLPSNGMPWASTFRKMVHIPSFKPLVHMLVSEGVITEQQIAEVKKMGQGKHKVIWEYGQPFPLNFLSPALSFEIWSEKERTKARVLMPFKRMKMAGKVYPYDGELRPLSTNGIGFLY